MQPLLRAVDPVNAPPGSSRDLPALLSSLASLGYVPDDGFVERAVGQMQREQTRAAQEELAKRAAGEGQQQLQLQQDAWRRRAAQLAAQQRAKEEQEVRVCVCVLQGMAAAWSCRKKDARRGMCV